MAEETKSLLENSGSGAFAESAARLEHLIQTVKLQQVEARPKPAAAPHNPLLAVSPDEEWSRKFQSQGFGPELAGLKVSELAPVPRAAIMPDTDLLRAVGPKREIAAALGALAATIGSGRGKPEQPRRSWFARLLRRS